MTGCLKSMLPLLGPGLADALAPRAAVMRLEALMAELPLFSSGLLECTLGQTAGRVDLAVRADAGEGEFKLFGAPEELSRSDSQFSFLNKWGRIQEFFRACGVEGSPLHSAVKEVWLEFDLDADYDACTEPNFFFKLEPSYGRPPKHGELAASRLTDSLSLIGEGVRHLGVELRGSALATLERCLRYLPATSAVSYVGVMLQRAQGGCRLTLSLMPLDELTAYLHKVGWRHAHFPLVPLLDWLRRHTSHVVLHLHVEDGIAGQLGMEVSFEGKTGMDYERFLTSLESARLCSHAEAAAIRRWPIRLHRLNGHDTWPQELPARYNYFVRAINHFKLVYEPSLSAPHSPSCQALIARAEGITVSAKTYLSYAWGSTFPTPALWRD